MRFGDKVNKETNSCNLCHKSFKTETKVFMHLGIKHKLIEEIIDIPKSTFENEENKKDYKDVTVTAIKSTNHESKSKKLEDQPIILHCQFCAEKYYELSDLVVHLKEHMLLLKPKDSVLHCAVSDCNARFHNPGVSTKKQIIKSRQIRFLEDHIRSKHTKATHISCEECGKKCFSSMSLHYHIKQHEDKSKFYCYKCEHFIQTNIYKQHISFSNCARNDAFKCEICGKGFAGQSYLDSHKDIHRNEKKYKCSMCLRSFNQKGNLKTHNKRKHSEVK